jgi:hypothetical protein
VERLPSKPEALNSDANASTNNHNNNKYNNDNERIKENELLYMHG